MQTGDAVILMTATVNPNGMGYTALQDPKTRMAQYLDAIDFYLRETGYDIVFCENTGANIFDEIKSPEKYARLEYMTFCGNDYDKERGKSYGEAQIIKYAIRNSRRLASADFVIKITGRVKILNMAELGKIASKKRKEPLYIVQELSSRDWAKSVCFLAPKTWLLETVERCGDSLHDVEYNFEKMLYRSVTETKDMRIYPYYPIIDGICGFNQRPYMNPHLCQRKLNNYNGLYHIYKIRGARFRYIIAKILWCKYVIEHKVYSCLKNGEVHQQWLT